MQASRHPVPRRRLASVRDLGMQVQDNGARGHAVGWVPASARVAWGRIERDGYSLRRVRTRPEE